MKTLLRTLALLLLPGVWVAGAHAQEAITLINPSFELDPNGNTPCIRVTNFIDVPGWSMDTPPTDSGVSDNANATDGVCAAWLANFDPQLWQLTEYVIAAGETYTLHVDARSSWQATTFDVILYYDDNGTRVPVATTTWDFEGISEPMVEITASFSADDVPEAIGHRLGVAVDNTNGDGDPDTAEDNSWAELDNVRLFRSVGTAVEREAPALFELAQNAPNPFVAGTSTYIGYRLNRAGAVRLEVFDVLGRRVRTLVETVQPVGPHAVRWDGRDEASRVVPPGLYFYRLASGADGHAVTRQMLIVR